MNKDELISKIGELRCDVDSIYLYGFGSYGRNLYKILQRSDIEIDGFVVTRKNGDEKCDIPILQCEDTWNSNAGYILALNEINATEVKVYLLTQGVKKNRIIDARPYIEHNGEKRGMRRGSIEITTHIGCKVACKYCPQNVLLSSYFRENTERTIDMTTDMFRRALDAFPPEYDLSFGGMAEPFLNERFVEMLEVATKSGRKVSVYTTLVGASESMVDRFLQLPIDFVVLHVADSRKFAQIEVNEAYYRMIDKVVHAKKANGMPFINMCNAQTEPDARVLEICKGIYEIHTEMTDRAGNLSEDGLIKCRFDNGKIVCGNMGAQMNSNVLLPDGSVILCCMDYALKHILGNICTDTYEQIMNGSELHRIVEGMNGDTIIDILCRSCSYARRVNDNNEMR